MINFADTINNIPGGICYVVIDGREVTIIEASPLHIRVRMADKPSETYKSVLFFYYDWNDKGYKENGPIEACLLSCDRKEHYFEAEYRIDNQQFSDMIKLITKQYTDYIKLKCESCDNSFSKELAGYPAELDEIFSNSLEEWKENAGIETVTGSIITKAKSINLPVWISLDNETVWKRFLQDDISVPYSGIYIGNAYCHLLIPNRDIMRKIVEKANSKRLGITFVLPYLREEIGERQIEYLDYVLSLSREFNLNIQYEINDIGWIDILRARNIYFSYGRLINKRRKDPRYKYKQRADKMAKMMKDNSLNDEGFVDYLKKFGLERIECETAGYEINIPNVKTALHVPLYQTNTSQFCPLYALVHNKDRGQQRLVNDCDMPCLDNAILYPDHLKMVGLYNSLFAVDTWLPDNLSVMDKYKKAGVDRIVLNYIPEVTV